MRPAPGSLGTSSDWHHYTISSCTDGKTITKVCTGLFRVEHEPAAGSAEAYELAEADRQVQARLLQARTDCRRRENPESFYMELARIGLKFGPAFRNMSEIWMGKSQSYCTVDVVNPSSKRASDKRRPFIIHPATFDPILQTITAALGLPSRTPVPTAIEELVISADIPCEVGRRLHVCSNAVPRGNYDILSDICALEEESGRPVMLLRGFKASQLPPSDLVGALEKAHKICGRIEWRPSLELLLSRQEDLRNVILFRINGEGEALNEVSEWLEVVELLEWFVVCRLSFYVLRNVANGCLQNSVLTVRISLVHANPVPQLPRGFSFGNWSRSRRVPRPKTLTSMASCFGLGNCSLYQGWYPVFVDSWGQRLQ